MVKSRIGIALDVLYPGEFAEGAERQRRRGFVHRWLNSVKGCFNGLGKVKAILSVVVVMVMVVVGYSVYAYNNFVTHVNNIHMAVANMENEQQRRNDLINNLVPPTVNYLVFEKNLFAHLADIRKELTTIDRFLERKPESSVFPREMMDQLPTLMGIFENYPDLKASKPFASLMKELIETENRIAAARVTFNDEVNIHNTYLTTIPSTWVAALLGYKVKDWFAAHEEASVPPDMEALGNYDGLERLKADVLEYAEQLPKNP